ncbi:MAG: segregation and condensation protein A [Actinomycetota bacterium]
MTYHVSTAVFEGPLGLLLQLITRHQVDIAEVSLTGLVEEYLESLDRMVEVDLDMTSEFLIIAATLIQLKAQRLLPSGENLDLDEDLVLLEERDRLLSRLLMCVTFKDVAAVLLRRLADTNRFVARISGLDQTMEVRPIDVTLPVDPAGIAAIAVRVFGRSEASADLDHLDLDLPSVEMAMDELRQAMSGVVESSFEDLVAHCRHRVEVAAYFLALLELVHWGMLEVSQQDWLAPIQVRPRDTSVLDLT